MSQFEAPIPGSELGSEAREILQLLQVGSLRPFLFQILEKLPLGTNFVKFQKNNVDIICV